MSSRSAELSLQGKTLEESTALLKLFLERSEENDNNQLTISPAPEFGSLAGAFLDKWGVSALAQAITEVVPNPGPQNLSPTQLTSLLDTLRGPSSTSFPISQLSPLLAELHIDWHAMRGEDLGEFFASLLLFAKAQSSPGEVGQSLHTVFTASSYTLTPDTTAAAIKYLWEEGFSWGRVPGLLLSRLLDDRWKLTNVPILICALVQGCLDSEELDLLDFDSLDRLERDAHNPAIRIGGFLDSLGLPEGCELALCANIVRAFIATFGSANAPNGSEAGPNVHPPRADIFIGRVLQQLSFAHESAEPDTGDSIHNWRVSAAIGLACSLCSGPLDRVTYDWRLDRQQHAYCVGEILQQLRPSWPPQDVAMLIEALRIPAVRGPDGQHGPGVPTRIVAEVIEGLSVDWDVYPLTVLTPGTRAGNGAATTGINNFNTSSNLMVGGLATAAAATAAAALHNNNGGSNSKRGRDRGSVQGRQGHGQSCSPPPSSLHVFDSGVMNNDSGNGADVGCDDEMMDTGR